MIYAKWEYEIVKAILSSNPVKEVIQKLYAEEEESEIEKAIQNILNTMQQADILNVAAERKFHLPNHYSCLEDIKNTKLKQMKNQAFYFR